MDPTRPRRASLLATFLVLIGLTVSAAADTQGEERAHELYRDGQKAYDIGEFQRAIDLFKQSYDALPQPGLLFNIGQAYRLLGDAPKAVFFYQNYLTRLPEAPNRARVEAWIAELKQKIAAEEAAKPPVVVPVPDKPVPTPVPVPVPVKIPSPDHVAEATPLPVAAPREDERRPFYKKWWFWTGTTVVVAGVVAYLLLHDAGKEPANPNTHFPTIAVF